MQAASRCLGLCRHLLKTTIVRIPCDSSKYVQRCTQKALALHTSCVRQDLMEFFEPKDNWGAQEVRSGKSWSKDELRIKSNSDLHKLWFVLLKEQNMLLTMEAAAKQENEYFPSPERIDKVKESMENLEVVVRERNEAYFLLETGRTGEQPWEVRENIFGLVTKYAKKQHLIPRNSNPKGYFLLWRNKYLDQFLKLYREKKESSAAGFARRDRQRVFQLLKRFPQTDRAILQERFPEVDLDKVYKVLEERDYSAFHGHW